MFNKEIRPEKNGPLFDCISRGVVSTSAMGAMAPFDFYNMSQCADGESNKIVLEKKTTVKA